MPAGLNLKAFLIAALMVTGSPAFAADSRSPAPAAPATDLAANVQANSEKPASAVKPAEAATEKSAAVAEKNEKPAADKAGAAKPGAESAPVAAVAKSADKAGAAEKSASEKSDGAKSDAAKSDAAKSDGAKADGAPKAAADHAAEKPAADKPAARATADSAHVPNAVLAARTAYETAFEQRRKGDALGTVSTIESAMQAIEVALAGQPDATTRRDLVELQARLGGLKDAARHDLEAPQTRTEPGNEADEKVLNAPAIDDIPLQMNTDVQRWIEFFTGAGRSTFERWLKRSGRYVELFRAVLQKEGLPPDLVHLVFVESGFNVNARSVTAAVGPWQFVKSTARLFGLTVDQWVDERKDPEKSTVAAARYLKHLYGIFGDWPLALASYNAGEGAVLRAIKAQGTTNYWDLKLPQQTEQYVPQFMAALAISRNPAGYGFDGVDLDDPMQFDEVALKGAVDLRAIARMCECSYEDLKALNPAVLRGAARGKDGITTIRVPAGKGDVLRQKLEHGASLPAVNLTLKHKVKRGETLTSIAGHYGVGARHIAQVNGIGRKRPLRTGMVLTIPAGLNTPTAAVVEPGDPRASTSYVPSRKIGLPAAVTGKSTVEGRKTLVVHRGQTLASIAEDNGVSVQDLKAWNHLKSSKVRPGTHLKIRAAGAPAVTLAPRDSSALAKVSLTRRGHHHHRGATLARRHGASGKAVRVRSGETLEQIARRNGVSVDALKRANGLASSRIRAGQRLKVPNG